MATNKISLDTGSTLHTGTYVITESALQINIPRSTLNDSAGAEIGVAVNPLFVAPSGGTIATIGSVTAIAGVVSVTGSVVVINTVAITGSTVVVNTVAITGSTTLVHVGFPNKASVYAEVTTAGTTTLVPSHATLSIYLTDLVVSNGAAAGSIKLGETNTTTASNVKIGSLYFAVNGGCVWPIINPIKCSATTPLVMTAVSCTTLSATATYYYAA